MHLKTAVLPQIQFKHSDRPEKTSDDFLTKGKLWNVSNKFPFDFAIVESLIISLFVFFENSSLRFTHWSAWNTKFPSGCFYFEFQMKQLVQNKSLRRCLFQVVVRWSLDFGLPEILILFKGCVCRWHIQWGLLQMAFVERFFGTKKHWDSGEIIERLSER